MKMGRVMIAVGVLGAVAAGAYAFQVLGEPDPNLNTDGDCMTDLEEVAAGTDPKKVDGDGDGDADGKRVHAHPLSQAVRGCHRRLTCPGPWRSFAPCVDALH